MENTVEQACNKVQVTLTEPEFWALRDAINNADSLDDGMWYALCGNLNAIAIDITGE
jgi:hypothetical protein